MTASAASAARSSLAALGRRPPAATSGPRRRRGRARRAAPSPTPSRAASASPSTCCGARAALVAPDRVEQRVLVVLGPALGPLRQRPAAADRSPSPRRVRHSSARPTADRSAPPGGTGRALGGVGVDRHRRRRRPASSWPARSRARTACRRRPARGRDIGLVGGRRARIRRSARAGRARRASTDFAVGRVGAGSDRRAPCVDGAPSPSPSSFSISAAISAATSIGSLLDADRSTAARASTCASASVASRNVRLTVRYASSR